MTWIKAPQDDYAVRVLQRKNTASSAINNPGRVLPSENEQQQHIPVEKPVRFKGQERRKQDRRKQDRRKNSQSVLLNTRSEQDRRRGDRRKAQYEDSASTLKHIDKFA